MRGACIACAQEAVSSSVCEASLPRTVGYTPCMVAQLAVSRTCCVAKRTRTVASPVEPAGPGKRMASRIFTAESCGITDAGMPSCRSQSAPLRTLHKVA